MNKAKLIVLIVAVAVLASCGTTTTVPITGRKQHMMVSDEKVLSLSNQQYAEYMKTAKPSTNVANTNMVKRVGQNLANAVVAYLNANGLSSEVANYKWEFNLVQNNQVNAFCMPGGKIVVYEGLMKMVSSEDELAVVIGHEVAHAVAKHSNERMSQQILAQYGSNVLNSALANKSAAVQSVAGQVFGLGAQYGVMLPFSRKQENEADYMGMVLMSMAGYNPDMALTFWQKMSAGGGASVPELLSTHPSDETRINNIKKNLPKIKQTYYKKSSSSSATFHIG